MYRFALVSVCAFALLTCSIRAEEDGGDIAPDQCKMVVRLPEGSLFLLRNYGYRSPTSEVTVDRLNADYARPVRFSVTYPSGVKTDEKLIIRGGTRVRISRIDPGATAPVPIVQLGNITIDDPNAESPGRWLRVCEDRGVVALCDMQSGWILRHYEGTIFPAAASSDERFVVATSQAGGLVVLDARTGQTIRAFGEGRPSAIRICPDNEILLLRSTKWRSEAEVWDIRTGGKLLNLESLVDSLHQIVRWPDGRKLLIAACKNQLIFWDLATGREIRTLVGPLERINSISVSPDSRWLVAGYGDDENIEEETILWDLSTGHQARKLRHQGIRGTDCSVFTPDGKRAITSNYRCTLVWDIKNGLVIREGEWRTSWLRFLEDDRTLVSTGYDMSLGQTFCFRDIETLEPVSTFSRSSSLATCLAVSPDGRRFATGLDTGKILLWDIPSGRDHQLLVGHETDDFKKVTSLAFGDEGSKLVSGSYDNSAIVWDIEAGTIQSRMPHKTFVRSVDISGDGRTILSNMDAITGFNHVLTIWNSLSGSKLPSSDKLPPIAPAAIHPDGRMFAGLDQGTKQLGLWDIETGDLLKEFKSEDGIPRVSSGCLAFSIDGSAIFTPDAVSHEVVQWDVETGRPVRLLEGLEHSAASIAASPDGRLLLAGGTDAKIWDARTGRSLLHIEGDGLQFDKFAFFPDGRHFASLRGDGSIEIRSIATGETLLRIYIFDEGKEWLAITPSGLYDGTAGGLERLTFRIGEGLRVVSRHRFIKDYHRPGLIAEIMRGERPLPGDPWGEEYRTDE